MTSTLHWEVILVKIRWNSVVIRWLYNWHEYRNKYLMSFDLEKNFKQNHTLHIVCQRGFQWVRVHKLRYNSDNIWVTVLLMAFQELFFTFRQQYFPRSGPACSFNPWRPWAFKDHVFYCILCIFTLRTQGCCYVYKSMQLTSPSPPFILRRCFSGGNIHCFPRGQCRWESLR